MTHWSQNQRNSARGVVKALLDSIPREDFFLAGLSGAPGCGKSTLAGILKDLLEETGTPAMVLSLDDYYMGKQQRKVLAGSHPLFAQRGVPGTHHWDELVDDIDRLKQGTTEGLHLPGFDKLRDDQAPTRARQAIAIPPRVVILEGWMIGSPPQGDAALLKPVNEFESIHDGNGEWRRVVNDHLARYDKDLRHRLDSRWFMSAPGWREVVDWRWQQEQEGVNDLNITHLANRQAVAGFLDPFQRIAMHMQATCEQWANVIIGIDKNHCLRIEQN